MRTPLRSPFLWLVLLVGCGSGGIAGDGKYRFPGQAFAENFDAGRAAARWECGQGGCPWDVVQAGHLATVREAAGTSAGKRNYVFQSPDPQALDLNPSMSCVAYPARFTQPGTFAFNYLIKTAGPILGGQDGNYLEVTLTSYTVEDDPEFGEVIVDNRDSLVLKETGESSSRFQMALAPGYYAFRFCYLRNRTFQIGPDFVQIDDVDTCVGTGCLGEIPLVPRCQPDQGAILVPNLSAIPTYLMSVTRVQGVPGRYHVIVNTDVLEFISGGLQQAGPEYDAVRAEVDGILDVVYVDGTTCEVDRRRSVVIAMTTTDIIDLVLLNATVDDLLDKAYTALQQQLISGIVAEFYQMLLEEILEKILGAVLPH